MFMLAAVSAFCLAGGLSAPISASAAPVGGQPAPTLQASAAVHPVKLTPAIREEIERDLKDMPAHLVKPVMEREKTATGVIAATSVYPISGAGAFLSGIHACRALGNDKTYQGVICAQLFAAATSNGGVAVFQASQGICETLSGTTTQCAENSYSMELNAFTASGALRAGITGPSIAKCGHVNGPCSSSRNTYISSTGEDFTGCNTSSPGPNEVWTTIDTGASIELPVSGKEVNLSANLASQHAIVENVDCA